MNDPGRLRKSSQLYARFLTWKTGREVRSPYMNDGWNGEAEEQMPMRYADDGSPVTFPSEWSAPIKVSDNTITLSHVQELFKCSDQSS